MGGLDEILGGLAELICGGCGSPVEDDPAADAFWSGWLSDAVLGVSAEDAAAWVANVSSGCAHCAALAHETASASQLPLGLGVFRGGL